MARFANIISLRARSEIKVLRKLVRRPPEGPTGPVRLSMHPVRVLSCAHICAFSKDMLCRPRIVCITIARNRTKEKKQWCSQNSHVDVVIIVLVGPVIVVVVAVT